MTRRILSTGHDDYDWAMADSKGYMEDVSVDLGDGKIVQVCFYDPVRLAQDIEGDLTGSTNYLYWRRLIVVKSVTLEDMQSAIDAVPIDFFD